jgi:hypothetical protein
MSEVPKIVVSRLTRHSQAGLPDVHPDANLLAAFGERLLSGPDRLQITEHLAQCSKCREILVFASPEPVTAALLPQPAVARWSSWPVLRWGAALACIVVVGAAVSLHQRDAHRDSSLQETHLLAGAGAQTEQFAGPGNSSAYLPAAPNSQADVKPENGFGQPQGKKTLATSRVMLGASGGTSFIKANPEAPQDDDMANIDLDSLVPGRAKEAPDGPLSPASTPMNGSMAVAESAAMLLTSPNLAPRWALTSDGSLQRSLDSGRSWTVIPISTQSRFHALAANGLDIWVGGDSGALYHSSDAGQHWMQIQPTENGQPVSADIIGVEFPDMEHGRVNTSTGEVWVTEDAGFTWKKQ